MESPEDVQRALAIVLSLFDEQGRARPLYGKAIKRACRLLNISYSRDDHWRRWDYWPRRMKLAGLDPDDPMRVVDANRWNLAWQQLVETGTFREAGQQSALNRGLIAPTAETRVVAIAAKKRKPRVTHTAQFDLKGQLRRNKNK